MPDQLLTVQTRLAITMATVIHTSSTERHGHMPGASIMDQVIYDFVYLLRQHAVRVSPAESIEALQALSHVGLAERDVVQDALRATLVKSRDDIAVFDRLFALYFGFQELPPAPPSRLHSPAHSDDDVPAKLELGEDLESDTHAGDDHEHTHEPPQPMELRKFFAEQHLREAEDVHGDPERLRLSLFAQQLILNRKQGSLQHILDRITYQWRVRRARNVFQPGSIAPLSDAEELPLDIAAAELQDLVDHLQALDVDEALLAHLKAQADHILEGLPELLRMMQERQKKLTARHLDPIDLPQHSLHRLLDLSASEQRDMEVAVRRLAQELHGAHTRRLRKDRTGRISLAHTVRQNLRFDGIPFKPVLRRRHEKRPRLVLLCDVSLSTRNLARFWLHLIHQMQSLFAKVRTFTYVADLVEVTHLFEEYSLNRAVETIFGSQLLDVDTRSDFGRATQQFCDAFLTALTHRTTVVILGDGRNNENDPNLAGLKAISQHARTILWLTPEPRWGWSLGSCDMPLYEPYCKRVEVVTSVEQLGRIAMALAEHHP
jgi:uncharacterized protein with von Willebrand factor type A (vWA) domain